MRRTWWMACAVAALALAVGVGQVSQWGAPVAAQQPAPVTKEGSAAFRRVVQQVLPAVVSVEARAKAVAVSRPDRRDQRDLRRFLFEGPMTPEDFRKFFAEMEEFGLQNPPSPEGGFGSGVHVQPGVILTNHHVVAGADAVEIRLQDGRVITSRDILRDPKTDLAVVRIDAKEAQGLAVAPFGDSSQLQIGDWILAMGAPFGLQGSVTAGIVSAKGRPLNMNFYEDFIQTDAATNPGNSGGPVVDLDGKVVGISTAIRSNNGFFGGIAFAIPSNMAKQVVSDLLKHGKVRRGYLGISMEELDPAVREKLGLDHGVLVRGLTPGSTPANKANLASGDIILAFDGTKLTESKQLQQLVGATVAGTKVMLKVHRDGKELELPVTIEEQPEEFGVAQRRARLRTEPAEPEGARIDKLDITVEPTDEGLIVRAVEPGSPAERAGLEEGALILQAEQRQVKSAKDLEQALAQASLADGILLKIRLPDGLARLIVIKE